ncbi:glycoside hydrolase [Exidia glandulosa HHB12029]|uniref:Glycoside hydrolase n=1 Tax=Exidia glandulosa HHB12029 TaxID=1314781 RepID=A0A165FDU8_EXIGL|nr:glycoside hydrolase [Exidia glandulosa HHB12029]
MLFLTLLSSLLILGAGARPTRRCVSDNSTTTHGGVTPPVDVAPPTTGNVQPRFVVYLDLWDIPTADDLTGWNVLNLAFLFGSEVDRSKDAVDAAEHWTALTPEERTARKKAYRDKGISLVISIFGANGWVPVKDKIPPVELATKTAQFVKKFDFDGVDVDYEEFDVFDNNPTDAIDWLVKYTRQLRQELPSPYIISHAPVAPWFTTTDQYRGGYREVHNQVGDDIDFYNIQFYNQGHDYEDCTSLFNNSTKNPGTSVFEIAHTDHGVPLNKIVVGKPGIANDASNGFIAPDKLGTCVKDAVGKGWNGGIMSWQWPNANADWIRQAKGGAFP